MKDKFELPERIFIWEGPYATPELMKDNYRQLALLKDYAQKGYAKAQFLMGYYYEHGLENDVDQYLYHCFVLQDMNKAIELYKLAANQGYPPAIQKLATLEQEM